MVRTKLDNRIRILIENGVISGHRSMFVIVGDKGKDQVPYFGRLIFRLPVTVMLFVAPLSYQNHCGSSFR